MNQEKVVFNIKDHRTVAQETKTFYLCIVKRLIDCLG